MIKFSAPGYLEHDLAIINFLHIMSEHPEYYMENRILDSAYGMPNYMIWNGGRSKFHMEIEGLDIYNVIEEYKKLKFKLRHTCTNYLLQPFLFNDFSCNQWLSHCQEEGHGVITFSEDFSEYIRKTFPQYQIIWSTTRRDNDINVINKLTKQNDLLVLDYKYNHDEAMLKSLANPHNIEILCGEQCIPNCPVRSQHYHAISETQLRMPQDNSHFPGCPYDREHVVNFYTDTLQLEHAITTDYVDYLYNTYGIENFKISGRNAPNYLVIEMLCYYLIKPEY